MALPNVAQSEIAIPAQQTSDAASTTSSSGAAFMVMIYNKPPRLVGI
jgi:hypothetical protein